MSGLAAAQTLAALAFSGNPAGFLEQFYTPEFVFRDECRVYVGYLHGRAVSTACGWIADGTCGVFNVATEPMFRGHGYATALVSAVLEDGFASGANSCYAQAVDPRGGEPGAVDPWTRLCVRLGLREPALAEIESQMEEVGPECL